MMAGVMSLLGGKANIATSLRLVICIGQDQKIEEYEENRLALCTIFLSFFLIQFLQKTEA